MKQNSIIIVDDDPSLLQMLKERFLLEGYHCETATSAESALELIKKASFDILLTDIAFPGMKGFELTKKVKKLRPETMVILMTGFIDTFSYDGAIEAGALDFIKKPFTYKELEVRIEHVKMQEKQRLMAITDELTGLSNRRGFFNLAEQQLNLAKRQKRSMFMLYADVDNLKGINDTLGHQKGDQALIEVSHLLKATFRESDIIARIGGDEFVVIPVETGRDNMEMITARFERNLDNLNKKQNRSYALSVSIGVVSTDPEHACSIDELLAQGDKKMYEQKILKRKGS